MPNEPDGDRPPLLLIPGGVVLARVLDAFLNEELGIA